MGVFDNLDKAPMPIGSGSYWGEGVYLVEVDRARHGQSSQGKGDFVAIEATCLETLVAYPARKSWIDGRRLPASNRPGDRCSQLIMMRHLSAPSNIKGFLVPATGLEPDQVNATVAKNAFGGDGTELKGTKLLLRAVLIKTKEGKPFTKHEWAVPTDDNIAKLRELGQQAVSKAVSSGATEDAEGVE